MKLVKKINISGKFILIGFYYLFLLFTIYFYEFERANDKNPPNCGTGYLIFLLPFFAVFFAILSAFIICIINANKKIKIYSGLLFLMIPLIIWLYFYGYIMLEIISIITDER